MRISLKILLPALLSLLLLAGMSGFIVYSLHLQQQSLRDTDRQLLVMDQLVGELRQQRATIETHLLLYLQTGKQSDLDAIAEADRDIARAVDDHPLQAGNDEAAPQLRVFLESHNAIVATRRELIRSHALGDTQRVRMLTGKWAIQRERVDANLRDLRALGAIETEKTLQAAAHAQHWMKQIAFYAILFAILVVAAAFTYVRHDVLSRLKTLTTGVRLIENGDLKHRIELVQTDEIGELSTAFNQMAERLHVSHLATAAEIAERQHAEERLAGIIASAMDGVITIDLRHTIVLVNPATERMFGYAAADLLGKTLDMLIPERFRAAHPGHIHNFGRTNVTSRAMGHLGQVIGRRASGDEFPIEASISQLEAPERLYTVILRDISQRVAIEAGQKKLDAELRQRLAERDAAIQELDAFTYTVSHDLRTPLRAVDGFAQLAVQELGPDTKAETKHYLTRVREGAQRMGNLIDDLLAFSRLGRRAMNIQEIASETLVQECLQTLRNEYDLTKMQIKFNQLVPLRGDLHLLKQVWINLLSNALKFTGKTAEAQIEIGSRQEHGETVYYVRDNGAGFDMRYADKLFGVFQRLHGIAEFQGTGVGLAIVQRIIKQHGGRIWAEAAPGQGATFHFTLGSVQP